MNDHIPSLSSIVDGLNTRMDNPDDEEEYQSINDALDILEAYMSRERVFIDKAILARERARAELIDKMNKFREKAIEKGTWHEQTHPKPEQHHRQHDHTHG